MEERPWLDSSDIHVRATLDLERLCCERAAALWPYVLSAQLGGDRLRLAAAALNLLFLSHPVNEALHVGRRGQRQVEAFTLGLLGGPAPVLDEELVVRHVLLRNLLVLKRTDVELRFWAGRRSFQGMEPPGRLLAWRRLRRVREERVQIPWLESRLSPGQGLLFTRLLAQTPLSDLLFPQRPWPPFRWLPVARYLRSPMLARVVAHQYLNLGLPLVGPALARAFWLLVDDSDPGPGRASALRLVGGLVQYLYAARAVAQPLRPDQVVRDNGRGGIEERIGGVLVACDGVGLHPGAGTCAQEAAALGLRPWIEENRRRLGSQAQGLEQRLRAVL